MNGARRRHPLDYVAPIRRTVLGLAAVGVGYLVWRYDVVTLPAAEAQAETGLAEARAGSRLWLDARPSRVAEGDDVLYRSAAGELRLGRVLREEAGGLVVGPDAGGPGADPGAVSGAVAGAVSGGTPGTDETISFAAVRGRVLFVWSP